MIFIKTLKNWFFILKKYWQDCYNPLKIYNQKEAKKLQLLKKFWKIGLSSGDAGEINFDILKKTAREKIAKKSMWREERSFHAYCAATSTQIWLYISYENCEEADGKIFYIGACNFIILTQCPELVRTPPWTILEAI